ncbi:MAG: glutamate-5-semialdehyde dehydrogenase [Candidatus Diapherotrites archaeon]|nr:glutamate-5-semialdehyde dehydrogenase [Candidatus Diapherotrites archaeon]
MSLKANFIQAKKASQILAQASTKQKNLVLKILAQELKKQTKEILKANQQDLLAGKKIGLNEAFLDRLELNKNRINGIIESVQQVQKLSDPVNQVLEKRILYNGLKLKKVSVPFGVIGVIYESRPNVTIDVAILCLKSGNACLLKGGPEANYSNQALTKIIQTALRKAKLPVPAVQSLNPEKKTVAELLQAKQFVDLIIPRGGPGLIKFVEENSKIPFLAAGAGICHIFVDDSADLKNAVEIVFNAKCQRPSVCNAIECVIVHEKIAGKFLPLMEQKLLEKTTELLADKKSLKFLKTGALAQAKDFDTEFLDYKMAVKTVQDYQEAIEFINQHGTKHSESILSKNKKHIQAFLRQVDSAAVYANSSTRFTDGFEFGLGAEIGISTSKFHARGPMALKELTTYKYVIEGKGQIRN